MIELKEVRRRIHEENDRIASELRAAFDQQGTLVIDMVSSPGSGKTTLLERTLARLHGQLRCGVLVGDIATERDANRICAIGIPAHQIVTGGACHLDARLVRDGLAKARLENLDVLFIENVGNLVCPASYDLGEDFKVALLSVTEGHDKPFKYPAIFSRADVTLVTKLDLLPHVSFDFQAAQERIRALHPAGTVLVTSATTGEGLVAWCDLITERHAQKALEPV